jgi:hypothetical protein
MNLQPYAFVWQDSPVEGMIRHCPCPLAPCTLAPYLPYTASSVAESADQHDRTADDDRNRGVLNRDHEFRHGDQSLSACTCLVRRAGRGRAVRDGGCRRTLKPWRMGLTAGGLSPGASERVKPGNYGETSIRYL